MCLSVMLREIETPLQNTIDATAFLSRIEAIEGAQDREENCEKKVQYEGMRVQFLEYCYIAISRRVWKWTLRIIW